MKAPSSAPVELAEKAPERPILPLPDKPSIAVLPFHRTCRTIRPRIISATGWLKRS